MSERLQTLLEQLNKLPDLVSFSSTIDAIRDAYDVDHVHYFALSLGLDSREVAEPKVGRLAGDDGVLVRTGRKLAALSYSPEWIGRYLAGKFHEFDPVIHNATTSFDPIDWSELDWTGADRREFISEAIAYGVGNQGYTIPVRGPDGQMAIFTVNKRCSDADWQRLLAEHRTDFLLLAHFTHQQILRLAGLEHTHTLRPLSNRERDAMRLIAEGLSRSRASEKLGISENTFRVYIDSARHKLGALNIPHAVALAAHRGIISPT